MKTLPNPSRGDRAGPEQHRHKYMPKRLNRSLHIRPDAGRRGST